MPVLRTDCERNSGGFQRAYGVIVHHLGLRYIHHQRRYCRASQPGLWALAGVLERADAAARLDYIRS